ncbi:MAG: carbohydrate ABC transporter permease [Sphaerochaetaceae bacterium]
MFTSRKKPDRIHYLQDRTTEKLMLLPSMVVLIIISIFPILYMLYISFFNYSISFDSPPFYFFKNWGKVFKNVDFWKSWYRTMIFYISGLSLEIILGVVFSLILFQITSFKNAILTLLMLPVFVAPIVAGLLGRYLLNSTYGFYAWLLQNMGYYSEVFGNPKTALLAIILIDVWEWTPLITLIFFSGLQSMDTQPLEASTIDGARYFQKLRYIIFPLCSRSLLVAIMIRSMDIIRYIDTISIITKGGPADSTKIAGWHLYEVAFRFQDFGQSAVMAIVMLFITIILGKLFVNLMDKDED